MSAVTHILISLKSGSITQAQAAAEIEELIELERVQLLDIYAAAALTGIITGQSRHYCEASSSQAFGYAEEMLKARQRTCTKSQTLAHYGEQARLAAQEGGAQ